MRGADAADSLPHAINLCVRIQFADDYDGDEAGGRFFQMMKKLDAEKTV
jgi:hypothetical protein